MKPCDGIAVTVTKRHCVENYLTGQAIVTVLGLHPTVLPITVCILCLCNRSHSIDILLGKGGWEITLLGITPGRPRGALMHK